MVPQPHGGDFTVYSATQIPHILKVMLGDHLGIPEHKLRVVAPSVGGGFGSKLNVYAEELLAVALARRLGVPVRWTEERTENAQSPRSRAGARSRTSSWPPTPTARSPPCGSTCWPTWGPTSSSSRPGIPLLGAFLYHGVYDVPAYYFSCTAVFTNLTPTDAYRGAGRPEATYAIERAMDALARAGRRRPGRDPAAQLHPAPTQFPYTAAAGLVFD